MILKNGTIVELDALSSLSNLQVLSADRTAMVETWNLMTEDNLSTVQIKNGDGIVVGNYKNLLLVSETSTVRPDNKIMTSYNLREKTLEEIRLDALDFGQSIQNGALIELAGIVGGA